MEQNRELRETHEKCLNEMEELKRFQVSTFETISMRKLIEDRDTILELTGKIQESQNEVNCMNDSKDFKDAESARSGPSHIPSQPALLPLPERNEPDPGGLLSRNNQPDIWNSEGISGNVFCKSTGVFFVTLSSRIQSLDF